jgi:hypothetical protein
MTPPYSDQGGLREQHPMTGCSGKTGEKGRMMTGYSIWKRNWTVVQIVGAVVDVENPLWGDMGTDPICKGVR